MKVALGFTPRQGPWGGGNRFAATLGAAITAGGDAVRYDLDDADLDIILLTDPRSRSPAVAFSSGAILRYLLFRNSRAIVIHRINECDERKGTRCMNAALVRANYCADYTVFVGKWLTELPVWRRNLRTPYSTIYNGTDTELFNPAGFKPWTGSGKLRLVTHHWGGNWMKGFDVYSLLDELLEHPRWQERLHFTYVGNLPNGFRFRNATHIPALDGNALATELKRHHAYVTASLNEPGGNHQNEAALSGLPILYRESGCLPEYCQGFGIPFQGPGDVVSALDRLCEIYAGLVQRMPAYPHTADRMTGNWLTLFRDLLSRREQLLEKRQIWRNPWTVLHNQIVG